MRFLQELSAIPEKEEQHGKGRATADSASPHRILTDVANIRNFHLWPPGALPVVKNNGLP